MWLAADMATGGAGDTRVLKPSSFGTGDLLYTDSEKTSAVNDLLGR